MSKPDKEWPKARHTCAVCSGCWIYTDGPQKGRCILAGPYTGYQIMLSEEEWKTFNYVLDNPPHPNQALKDLMASKPVWETDLKGE